MMMYGSLQAEFMETNYNSHIHRYGTCIFSKIVVNISKPINNNNQILSFSAYVMINDWVVIVFDNIHSWQTIP